ncbi:MAG: TonB-dependent receptor [Candidatus Andeanibacterium colombiense]|uniref:TonB-dependent receptor n=1 Tax=Candidatus Andeanibacterium colombiense TaxID=3121345 RepID=A0AAJ5X239_9SPHN|nr:MAG: TonB-dependent receptor [Sphingomonadaceae bacterium]
MKRTNSARIRALKTLCLSLTCLSAVPLLEAPAAAQSGKTSDAAQKSYDFNIAGQSLSSALTAFAAETGLQIVYSQEDAGQIASPGVKGRMSADAALARLTAGTGYTFQYLRAGVVTLVKASAGGNDGEVVTGVVSVEGVQGSGSPYFGGAGQAAGVNGVNGSRDITATEGTGSFTSGALTIGSKVPQALKDVPQSISVLTSERLAQQNITDFTTAMAKLPGITLVQGSSSLVNTFYSRGFEITSIQVDGGAPLSTQYGFYPQIDMSIYDHVELLRGAAGEFGAYGDPSGTVNLVRKKPLDHSQFSVEAQAGSWQNYRVVADATSPLALDGKLRGRMVMTYQDNHYFYDTAKDNKTLIYGVAEFDASPTTLLTAGISYTRQNSLPWQGGLPRYWNGGDLGLPRSTSLVFPWNRWNFETTEIFGGVEQKIGEDWTFELNLTHNRQSSYQKLGFSGNAVSPFSLAGPEFGGILNDYASKQFSAEATLSGAFELFGQRQEVTIGGNRVKTDGGGQLFYGALVNPTPASPYQPYPGGPIYCSGVGCPMGSIASRPPIDVFNFDPSDPLYTEPVDTLPIARYPKNGQTQSSAYISQRLTAFDRLHLLTAIRWSRYENISTNEDLCTNLADCTGMQIGDVYNTSTSQSLGHDFSWPPPISLSFDVTKTLTAYAGYTDIYQNQDWALDHSRNPLPPVTGSNWEAGLKWAANGGRLNLSLAAYRIEKKGFAVFDPTYPSENLGNTSCCWIADPEAVQRSKGIDIEVAGEIASGWQISASYTYSENKQENGSALYGTSGEPFVTIQPKHLYKLWMSYDFGTAGQKGLISGLTLSGGVDGQSSAYYSGTVCTGDYDVPYPEYPNYRVCEVPQQPYNFTVPGHAVISARIDYRLSEKWSLAINLQNLFDKIYYQTVGEFPVNGNWYGAPRSYTATLRAKW